MRENYDFYCNLMKDKADKKLRELNPDLYDNGYLEQEQETINEDIESLLAGELLVWDDERERYGDEREDISKIYFENADEWFNDFILPNIESSVDLVVDWLEEVKKLADRGPQNLMVSVVKK